MSQFDRPWAARRAATLADAEICVSLTLLIDHPVTPAPVIVGGGFVLKPRPLMGICVFVPAPQARAFPSEGTVGVKMYQWGTVPLFALFAERQPSPNCVVSA